jgi:hypothetical protein
MEPRPRRWGWLGPVALLVVAAAWLLASNGLLGPVNFADPNGPDPRPREEPPPEPPPPAEPVPPGPIGVGSVAGRIVRSEGGPAVGEAELLLTGIGNGGEAVSLRTQPAGDGTFRIVGVAAGGSLILRIETPQKAVRHVTRIVVRDGQETDLGTVLMEPTTSASDAPR